jgi:protein-tyrosine phosphatase
MSDLLCSSSNVKKYAMAVRVIFICYENICRSPMAEGIFSALLARNNLHNCISVSSAGTVSYQKGSPPDNRAIAALLPLGIDITSMRARTVLDLDMHAYDWIFVMDHENYEEISSFFITHERPRIHRVMEFVDGRSGEEISDPYYGTQRDFDRVVHDLVSASEEILVRMFEHYPYLAQQSNHS